MSECLYKFGARGCLSQSDKLYKPLRNRWMNLLQKEAIINSQELSVTYIINPQWRVSQI